MIYHSQDERLRLRLDKWISESSTSRDFVLVPRQFPRISLNLMALITRKVWVDFTASATEGLSFTLPLCLMHPKNFSKGSWFSLPLIKADTPGRLRIRGTNSKKDDTVD